jgi:hypothetical protein
MGLVVEKIDRSERFKPAISKWWTQNKTPGQGTDTARFLIMTSAGVKAALIPRLPELVA